MRWSRPTAFTLLELLIAVVLSAVLMAGLWALLSTYQSLFSRGQEKVEHVQLVRALLEQITSDLESAIPDCSAAAPGEAPLRRFGLFGTGRALQVDVLQVTTSQMLELADNRGLGESRRVARVPELHTVQYLFEEPTDLDEYDSLFLTGLVRRELDWEAPADDAQDGSAVRRSGSSALRRASAVAPPSVDPMDISGGDLDPTDGSLLHVPEIVALEFRYYDGSGWTSQWNSLARKSLPVAVEVSLTLRVASPSEKPRRAAPTDLEAEMWEAGFLDGPPADTETYRALVYLPSTAIAQAGGADRREGFSMLVPPRLPAFMPSPLPPRPSPSLRAGTARDSLQSVLEDQWMRTGR